MNCEYASDLAQSRACEAWRRPIYGQEAVKSHAFAQRFRAGLPDNSKAGYYRDMASLLPILAIAFAAFCLWLTVRIINRREKWAKQLAMGLGVLTAYPLSFGPACWLTSYLGQGADLLPAIYRPLLAVMRIGEEEKELRFCDAYGWMEGRPERVPNVPNGRLSWFANFGAAPGWHWRYEAIYTIRSGLGDDLRIRLGDQAWEWSDRP